ncbi:unknown [[Mannheimia] succiniciproducens MBEL55E]|uniref:Uncharacterized protein n=1 Tax=Mannheimia succiniciproducens (strain KCTC 0769BP / MBEL55E) TaxID=221988 RepID=Q65VI2_MANSM|nr:unknown [[Mannheimia] succiniciproducens MBEL55E]
MRNSSMMNLLNRRNSVKNNRTLAYFYSKCGQKFMIFYKLISSLS